MPPRILAFLLAATFSGCASAPATRDVQAGGLMPVGVAEADITPTESIRLTGYGNRDQPTAEVRQRLFAKALAFGADPDPAVLIAVDLVGIPAAVTDAVARRLAGAHVRREQFVVSATHTHTGPSLTGVLPHIFNVPATAAEQQAIDRYTATLSRKLEEAARAALAGRQPSRVSWA